MITEADFRRMQAAGDEAGFLAILTEAGANQAMLRHYLDLFREVETVSFVREDELRATGEWAVSGSDAHDAMIATNRAGASGVLDALDEAAVEAEMKQIEGRLFVTPERGAAVMEFEPRVIPVSVRDGQRHAVGRIHIEKDAADKELDRVVFTIIAPYIQDIDWLEISVSDDVDPPTGFMSPRWGRFDQFGVGVGFMTPPRRARQGRGMPCSCGSGIKAKRCCRSPSSLREARGKSKGTVLIDEIRVMPQARGQGIGTGLVHDLHDAGFDLQAATIMPDSIGFWQGLGFRTRSFGEALDDPNVTAAAREEYLERLRYLAGRPEMAETNPMRSMDAAMGWLDYDEPMEGV